ncbi:MAG: tryptophanase [Chloroflexi bacterium]|nr:tryptophanase [Chloroflexota bacterium]
MAQYTFEPFKIKTVEAIPLTTRAERAQFIRGAGYNVFHLPSRAITFDFLTDSGTSAMSDRQWAGMMEGDESYAGSRNYYHLREVVQDIFGFEMFVPTHQGRGAEQVLFGVVAGPGKTIPNNTHFDTTRANIEARGSTALDLIISEGLDPTNRHPFKGNMNVAALEELIRRVGVENIPLAMMTITNNAVGGQPVSMANIRATKELLARYHIPFYIDACRYAENCYFIQQREAGYRAKSIKEIARELFSYADGFTMSAKKDGLVNIGGLLATRDPGLFEQLQNRLILTEGFVSYGGLARRDLEALARGLEEALGEKYLAYRTGQIAYLAERLLENGVPIVEPPGGHAVFLDAKRFLPHVPQSEFPGQALTIALYLEGGIRACEIGSVMFAHKDAATGEVKYPALDLVRLAIPRRVYTQSHFDYVAQVIANIYRARDQIRGVKIVYEQPRLRHFTARFEEV